MYRLVLTYSARSGSDTFGTGCFPVTKRSGAARRCEHLRDIQHSAAQGVAVMKTSGAARRCEHLEDIQHSAAQRDCDENLQCDAKMRALASHTAQRGTRCRVLTTTCGAVRRCDHLQDIQHSAADSAVVVTKTCGAARRCEHLLEIETAWQTVPLLPLLAECVRTTPGPVRAEFFHKLRKLRKLGKIATTTKKKLGKFEKKSKIKLSKIGEKNCKNSKN